MMNNNSNFFEPHTTRVHHDDYTGDYNDVSALLAGTASDEVEQLARKDLKENPRLQYAADLTTLYFHRKKKKYLQRCVYTFAAIAASVCLIIVYFSLTPYNTEPSFPENDILRSSDNDTVQTNSLLQEIIDEEIIDEENTVTTPRTPYF